VHWDEGPAGDYVSWASQAPLRPAGHPRSCRTVIRRPGNASRRQQAPGLPRWAYAAIALTLPYSSARAHRLSVLSFHGPDSELQMDILEINIWLIYELSRRGA